MRAYRSRCRRRMLELLTLEHECSSSRAVLPTLVAGDAERASETNMRGNPTLRGALLPTLCARDEKGIGPNRTKGGQDLPRTLGGHLSASWCRWFMGFPAGWLDVFDVPLFARSDSRSYLSVPRSLGGSCENSKG